MAVQVTWLKPGIWGAVIGSILTMIVGFSYGGWTTSGTASLASCRVRGKAAADLGWSPTRRSVTQWIADELV